MAAIRAMQSVSFRQSAATGARVSSRVTRVPAAATRSVVKCASEYKWYPGAKAPEYLDGSMAGDYGFDPLRLGSNSEYLPYFREAELMNGRYAMLGTAGIMLTDGAGVNTPWWEAGAGALTEGTYGYDLTTLIAIEVLVMGFFEYFRIKGWQETGSSGLIGFVSPKNLF